MTTETEAVIPIEEEDQMVNEELKPTGDGARSERQDWRVLRTLDAEVAERVMGFTRAPEQPHPTDNRVINGVLYYLPGTPWDRGQQNVVPYYSTDIAAAMEVVEAMRARGYRWDARTPGGKGWEIRCYRTDQRGRGEKFRGLLPEAICHAALSLVDAPKETK